jgi:competence protein ComEC
MTHQNKVVLIIDKQLKSTTYHNKYFASVTQINQQKTIGNILLNIQKDSLPKLHVDDQILIMSDFKLINKPLNLHQFDYSKYLETQGVYHQISCKNSELIRLKKQKISLNGLVFKLRENINHALTKFKFKNDELAIINALLLGQRQSVSKTLLQSYAGAGAIHILAVSGLHIGILLYLLNVVFKPVERFKKGKIIKLILVILCLWTYALIAGFSASVIRAVTMFTAIAIGMMVNKKTSTIQNLFISMFFLLLIKPLYLFSVGFQLSYLAVFSIVYFQPLFMLLYQPKYWIFKKVWQLFSLSLSAQIGILPLSLYYFHQFPSLFFVSSIVIIPFLGFILGFGILVIILALSDLLPIFIADSFVYVISRLNAFIFYVSEQESFIFRNISFSIALLMASYLFIILSYHWMNKSSKIRIHHVFISILLIQMVILFEKWQLEIKQDFIVFNKTKTSIVMHREGNKAFVFHNLDSLKLKYNNILKSYRIGEGHLEFNYKNKIKNIYKVDDKTLLVIDSLGIYKLPKLEIDMVLLRQSPKINLDRLIEQLHPKLIIVDASNYKTYTARWQQTCISKNIPFYTTNKQGAINLKNLNKN